jgi:MFS family permease
MTMSASMRRMLAWLPMLGVFALAARAAAVWDRLPLVMASHFVADGTANGWMPRNAFFVVSFVSVIPAIVLLAFLADRVGRRKPLAGAGLLALNWLVSALLLSVFWGAIDANLDHGPLRIAPVWVLTLVVVPLALAIGIDWRWWFSPQRKAALQEDRAARVIAEERHGVPAWAILFLMIAVGTVAPVIAQRPRHTPGPFVAMMVVVILVMFISALWAWRGFVYRFTTAGVEVRALGIRLRRIPLSQIREFKAEEVHPLTDFGGWGVKGFGSDTAYIWGGHTALHIKTNQGDVYLGHKDPERLVRDLEAIMKPARQ